MRDDLRAHFDDIHAKLRRVPTTTDVVVWAFFTVAAIVIGFAVIVLFIPI